MFYSGFDALFSILFPLVFLFVLGMILFTVVGNLRTWSKNNASPRLTVPATVVAKRMNVSRHHTANAGDMTGAHGYTSTSATTYYVTFQVESGDRMELSFRAQWLSVLFSAALVWCNMEYWNAVYRLTGKKLAAWALWGVCIAASTGVAYFAGYIQGTLVPLVV